MADYIYTMETRLTPDQQRGVSLVQETARAHEINVYLTGGAIRDLISGLAIRDLDFTVQGNPAKLQKDLERSGAIIQGEDEGLKAIFVLLPGNVRGEIAMARSETYEKPGKRPEIAPATITDDLRRRDFSVNAMALSLNPGSRGLLLDPTNGVADIEAKLLRVLGNYSFLEDPSRLIRATRLAARFHWQLEERTQARYNTAKEENYIDRINNQAIGYEIESLAYEDDPLHILKALEKEGWLKVLNPHWSAAKVDSAGLAQLMKMRQQMSDLGYTMNVAPAVMYFLTSRLPERDISEMQRLIPRKEFVTSWRRLEDEAKELAKKLTGKEAATPSRAWRVLTEARPETMLFLQVTSHNQSATTKIRNFFGKWRQVKDKLPLLEMTELHITPSLPEYPKLAQDVFMLLLDGKLRSRTETLKFLKPYAPPPPPPPPPPKRGRAARAAAAAVAAAPTAPVAAQAKGKKQKGKPGEEVAQVVAAKLELAPEKGRLGKPSAKLAAAQASRKPPKSAARTKPAVRKKPAARKKPAKSGGAKKKGKMH